MSYAATHAGRHPSKFPADHRNEALRKFTVGRVGSDGRNWKKVRLQEEKYLSPNRILTFPSDSYSQTDNVVEILFGTKRPSSVTLLTNGATIPNDHIYFISAHIVNYVDVSLH